MTIALYSLASPLHKEAMTNPTMESFIMSIEKELGESFTTFDNDFISYGTHERDIIYIRTGGTEGLFKRLKLKGDIMLLTSGESNSLAASMEILSYLQKKGQKGEILHGSPEYIANRIKKGITYTSKQSSFIKPMPPTNLKGARLGVIGKPSDWLISSDVDYNKAKKLFNIELVDIEMSELLNEISRRNVDMHSLQGSEAIYYSLKVLVNKYKLSGLTIRCFDLLDTVHNTGCLALAKLNSEGIPSSCEGDIPALISMVYLQQKTGIPGFQCNLSKIKDDNLLFAHCTVPLNMLISYKYTTHFESGIGTAIKGELPLGEVEIFKISPDLEHYVSISGAIISNESKPNLCRTQIIVKAPFAADYFLHNPLANHHIISFKAN